MPSIDDTTANESGVMPLKDPKLELFARKVCDGMSPEEAYRTATGKMGIEKNSAEKTGRSWMKQARARITYITDQRAKNFIKADDTIRQMKEKAALTRSKRPHVDVSTFEGRKQFFQDVCDDYQFNDGIDVNEAINAVKELMKINGDFNRREDDVAKTDPAMVMAVIARAHLADGISVGEGVMDIIGLQAVADAMRDYFKLDYVHLISVERNIDCSSRTELVPEVEKQETEKPESEHGVERLEI